jgi:hypothetical protein
LGSQVGARYDPAGGEGVGCEGLGQDALEVGNAVRG